MFHATGQKLWSKHLRGHGLWGGRDIQRASISKTSLLHYELLSSVSPRLGEAFGFAAIQRTARVGLENIAA